MDEAQDPRRWQLLVPGLILTLLVVFGDVWVLALSVLITGLPVLAVLYPGVWLRRGAALPAAQTQLERRRPVWDALSSLYLDTQLDEREHAYIADVLDASGYSLAELDEILFRELHPILFTNLLDVAGEWAGFDLDWLEQRILARRRPLLGVALIPGMWLVCDDWRRIRELLSAREA